MEIRTATAETQQETPVPVTGPPPGDLGVGWELVRQWRRALTGLRWATTVAIVLGVVVVLSEATRYYDFFARIHWALGYFFVAAMLAGMGLLVGVPVWRYLRLPAVVEPPDVSLKSAEMDPSQLALRARFVCRYCRGLLRNPELADKQQEIRQVAEESLAVWRRARTAGPGELPALVGELRQLESQRVEPLLTELDDRVDAYIRQEAVSVGIATAVSMNGTLDAFVVLWRNANMVSRISRYYYGRAGLRGSLRILRDVAAIVVLSRTMDDLSDMAGDLVGRTLGNLAGVFVGPVVDGAVNAVMTMKVGYLAKRRCRSFEAWTEEAAKNVLAEVLRRVTAESAGIIKELLGRVGGVGVRAASAAKSAAAAGAGAVASAGRNAWSFLRALFYSGGEGASGEPANGEGQPLDASIPTAETTAQ
ncbi:MAG: YcjF family protein [Planctomycetes bacterium]|nr:YcjF family protein [Planctomycetota bacterium]